MLAQTLYVLELNSFTYGRNDTTISEGNAKGRLFFVWTHIIKDWLRVLAQNGVYAVQIFPIQDRLYLI